MIRVLIAEDSATARALLVALLAADPEIRVVGEARTGAEAVEMTERLQPDLVTMDVHMPEMDGLEATKQIMTRSPRPIIIVSTAASDDVELSLEATRSGALMVIAKPQGVQSPTFATESRQLLSMVRALAAVKVVRRHGAPFGTPKSVPSVPPPKARNAGSPATEVLAIAASTGGPAALRTILAELPASFPVPVLVVQHIARGFTAGLAHWLAGDSAMPVKLAELGERALPGRVYIAPDDRHLGLRRGGDGELRIVLDSGGALFTFRPSATYLFRSCAENVGRSVLALILTGMGDDGVDGLRDVRRQGGRILAQDESSSVIYGMPREAHRAGVVDMVVGLDETARRLIDIVS